MTAREWIASVFVGWTDVVLRHPRIVAAVHAVVLGILAAGLPWIRLETSFESYLPEDNPARTLLEEFRHDFGSGERIVVLLEPEALYDVRFLEGLRTLHSALEERMPHLERVTSLVDARHLVGSATSLSSAPLLDPPPLDDSSLDRLRRRIHSNPLYTNWIVSEDERATALVIELEARGGGDDAVLGDEAVLEVFEDGGAAGPLPSRGELLSTAQSEEVVRTLEDVLEARAPPSTAVYVSGTPLIAHRLGELLTRDMVRFVGTSLVLTALLLFALFGSGWAVAGPLVVVGFAVVATLGWMGWTGEPITAVTEVLPSLLLAIGVADAIHVQSLFYKYR
jgi:predicted RND superfamily exporter protein